MKRSLLLRLWNRLRLFFFYNFNPPYIINKLKERKGECNQCGSCCTIGGCFYVNDKGKCTVYNSRPRWCHIDFPIDNTDLKASCVKGKCGYYWDKK